MLKASHLLLIVFHNSTPYPSFVPLEHQLPSSSPIFPTIASSKHFMFIYITILLINVTTATTVLQIVPF